MTDQFGGPFQFCAKFLIAAGLSALVLWISFRSIRPRYYLISFSLSLSSPNSSSSVSFQLEIENKNRQLGIDHEDIALTLFAGSNISSPISHSLIPAFYQGHLKTADKSGNFTATGNQTRAAAGASVFRVAVSSAYRYKVLSWKSGHHAVSIAGDVEVDAGGKKTAKKGIRLSSACAPVGFPVVPVGFLLYSLLLLT